MPSIKGLLSKFATSVRGALESKTKTKERLEKERLEKETKKLKDQFDRCEEEKTKETENLKSKIKEKETETENLKSKIKEKETETKSLYDQNNKCKEEKEQLKKKYDTVNNAYDTVNNAYTTITSQIMSIANYGENYEREDNEIRLREQKLEDEEKAKLNSIINEPDQKTKINKIIINEQLEINKDHERVSHTHASFDIDILNKTLIEVFTGHPSHIIKYSDPIGKYIPIRESRKISYNQSFNQDPYIKYILLFYDKYYRNL